MNGKHKLFLVNILYYYNKINPQKFRIIVITNKNFLWFNLINLDLAHCSKCDLSANLWLCLTCGNLGCGRKAYDGTGGNNHGVEHF